MKVFHFGGETDCTNIEELNSVLANKHENNSNEFELRGNEEYPFMTILVKGEWACVHFFENEDDCGHYAYSDKKVLDEDGYTTFYMGSATSETEISNQLVIPFSTAINVAKEFFTTSEMSKCVEWFEL